VAYPRQARSAAQKKSLHAIERDTEENLDRREVHLQTIGSIAAEDLIYVDESGVSTQMTRLYGRAPKGRRIRDRVPAGHWKILTILGAMDHTGMLAAMTVESATDGDVFLAFLDQVLCPKLRPGHVVVMDNLSAHKVDGVRERIEACGASVLYLPPYSPDLNPIEKAWSKLKARLRALAARAMPQLEHATAQALQTITPQDAKAWLRLRFGNYT
jgi:transposase